MLIPQSSLLGLTRNSTGSLQKRSYVFFPTSWTELKLRLRQKANPTVLQVVLQRHKRKFLVNVWPRRKRLGAATRLSIRKAQRRLSVAPILPHQGHRGLFSRVREMFTGKGKVRSNIRRSVARQRAFSQEEVMKVTVEDYIEPSWFDVKGRPLVSRDATGRFVNPWISQSADGVKPLSVLWKWREQRLQRELKEFGWNIFIPTFFSTKFEKIEATSSSLDDQSTENGKTMFEQPSRPSTIRFTWIGHSTCLIQQGNVKILTDPIFSERASPFPRTPIGVQRARPAACTIPELPEQIDICLISHDHYDHLDKPSVRKLRNRVQLWIVPLGTKEWMVTKGKVDPNRVVEMEWWESVHLVRDTEDMFRVQRRHLLRKHPYDAHPAKAQPPTEHDKELWITCCPVQHWCSRTHWDRNYRLWASYAVLLPYRQTFYFTGDTALPDHFPLFAQIRSYLPWPISLAAIPIGAYDPAILNDDSHANPREAVQIHRELKARQSVAIHHGSFPLSEEPLDEPAERLATAVVDAGLRPHEFVAIADGEYLDCPSLTNRLSQHR